MDDPALGDALSEFQKDIAAAYGDFPVRSDEDNKALLASIQTVSEQSAAAMQSLARQMQVAIAAITSQLTVIAASVKALQQERAAEKIISLSDVKTDESGKIIGATVKVS